MNRNHISILLLPLVLVAASCASVRERAYWMLPGTSGRLADDVLIQRDAWGVPYIYGESDAAAAFGLGYAQAEDDFAALEALYIRALGRLSNLWGESQIGPDHVRAAFDVQRLAREEYAREPAHRKRIWDAFAMGVNHYLDGNPEIGPRLLHRFEGWHAFAIPRSRLIDVMETGVESASELGVGWAVTPSKTTDGRAYVLLELAGRASEADELYEAHVKSGTGWRVSGVWLFGTAAPVAGHDGHRAWSRSVSIGRSDAGRTHDLEPLGPDTAVYVSGGYSIGTERRVVELPVNTAAGVLPRAVVVHTSPLGPIIRMRGDTAIAYEIDGFAEGGLLSQLLELSRANGPEAFAAAATPAAPAGRVFYADADGRVARGDLASATGARETAVASEIGSAPSAPFAVVAADGGWALGVPIAAADPDGVLALLGWPDARLAAVASALAARESWSFDEFAALGVEATYRDAPVEIARLVDVWERIGATDRARAAAADQAIDLLRMFDGVIDTTSAAATLYAEYARELGAGSATNGTGEAAGAAASDYANRLDALARAAARVRTSYGRIETPLREAWRLATKPASAATTGPPGIAVRAGPSIAGSIAAVRVVQGDADAPGRVTHARTWVMAVALGATVDARSAMAFGGARDAEIADTLSYPYAAGELKPVPFDSASVAGAVVRRYRPGERPGG